MSTTPAGLAAPTLSPCQKPLGESAGMGGGRPGQPVVKANEQMAPRTDGHCEAQAIGPEIPTQKRGKALHQGAVLYCGAHPWYTRWTGEIDMTILAGSSLNSPVETLTEEEDDSADLIDETPEDSI